MRDQISEQAFDDFAAEVARPLFHSAYLLTGDWHLAEDLVQESFARIYRGWPVALDHPLAYARKTLIRTFLSYRRRPSSTERPSERLPEQSVTMPDVELRQTLVDALLGLPERDRTVLVLRYLADRSVEDVASDLGRTPNAIRTQSSRALAKLCALLGGVYADLSNP